MRPPLTGSSPEIKLNSVVFPAPFGPISARRSPGCTASVTRSTACNPPNERDTPSSSSAAELIRAGCSSSDGLRSAVLARRVVARVERRLHVLLGVVLPELADVGEGRDDAVLQLAADLLD